MARRLTARNGHFFPPELLDSQFGDLEPPADDEHPVRVKVDDHDAPLTVAENLIRAEHLEAVETAHDKAARVKHRDRGSGQRSSKRLRSARGGPRDDLLLYNRRYSPRPPPRPPNPPPGPATTPA